MSVSTASPVSAAPPAFPPGICSWENMPYGFRRWNGTVWCNAWVDDYNQQLDQILRRFEDSWHVDDHIEIWYRTLTRYDLLAKELATERAGR